jgi:hypothetical protein
MFAKFCPPVVANGKVYLATFAASPIGGELTPRNKLVVYGLLNGNDRSSTVANKSCLG